jgi:hypothetical protein
MVLMTLTYTVKAASVPGRCRKIVRNLPAGPAGPDAESEAAGLKFAEDGFAGTCSPKQFPIGPVYANIWPQ